MNRLALIVAVSAALVGCTEQKVPAAGPAPAKQAAADPTAGKSVAERDCKSCHGLDGKGVAPGIPNLAGQRERYLLASIKEYKDGKRSHAALKEMMTRMSDADTRNVAAYFAALPAAAPAAAKSDALVSPYEQGKALAAPCAKCHGEDGNSKTPGTPTLAGQQPHYLVAAIQEYHQGERQTGTMKSMLRDSTKLELESLALFFASQNPVQRSAPSFGNAAAGEPASAMCGGCHGSRGVSADAATPSLAGQDAQYLAKAIKAYRTTRQHWGMQRYVAGLGDKDVENIVAFYAVQKPQAADKVPSSTQELAQQCNRCHDADNAAVATPILKGQDKDYLAMSLRSYRDGKRESSTMHNMSTVYSNAIIQSLSAWYASQPPK
ncbi:MAG: c-type cytochrome [Usitatibacter sp.]